jgi:hypothetical protein
MQLEQLAVQVAVPHQHHQQYQVAPVQPVKVGPAVVLHQLVVLEIQPVVEVVPVE